MKKVTTIILVAGKSSRFKGNKAKIYHDLAGLPIINHIYNSVKKLSNKIIFVCNKNNINFLKNSFPDCDFIIQVNQIGTADAVLSAKKLLKKDSNILILFGDTPLVKETSLKKLVNNFFKSKYYGSMLAFKTNNPFAYGRVITKNTKVISIIEEINATEEIKKINLCNSGIMITNYKILFSNIKKIKTNKIKNEKYLPDIFDICNKINKPFNYILCEENEMLGVNTLEDFNKIDEIYQNLLKSKLISKGVVFIEPKKSRISFDTKIGKGSVIEPFVYIKNNVIIKENVTIKSHSVIESSVISASSSIGPFARLRPKTVIGKYVKIGNYVEIKNSFIGEKTSINHLSYIGDSKLGKKINIGAGTITCNFDGKNKNQTIIEDNVFVGSNTSLIAPIKIGKNAKIGAGSVINQNIPPNSLALERAKLKIIRKNKKK